MNLILRTRSKESMMRTRWLRDGKSEAQAGGVKEVSMRERKVKHQATRQERTELPRQPKVVGYPGLQA